MRGDEACVESEDSAPELPTSRFKLLDEECFDAGLFDAGSFDAGSFDAASFDAASFDAGSFVPNSLVIIALACLNRRLDIRPLLCALLEHFFRDLHWHLATD